MQAELGFALCPDLLGDMHVSAPQQMQAAAVHELSGGTSAPIHIPACLSLDGCVACVSPARKVSSDLHAAGGPNDGGDIRSAAPPFSRPPASRKRIANAMRHLDGE